MRSGRWLWVGLVLICGRVAVSTNVTGDPVTVTRSRTFAETLTPRGTVTATEPMTPRALWREASTFVARGVATVIFAAMLLAGLCSCARHLDWRPRLGTWSPLDDEEPVAYVSGNGRRDSAVRLAESRPTASARL